MTRVAPAFLAGFLAAVITLAVFGAEVVWSFPDALLTGVGVAYLLAYPIKWVAARLAPRPSPPAPWLTAPALPLDVPEAGSRCTS